MSHRFSVFLVILSTCLWGSIGLVSRILTPYGFDSGQIGQVRCLSAGILLLLFLLLYRRRFLVLRLKDLWLFIAGGIVPVLGYNLAYMHTVTVTSLSITSVLCYTSPVFVMLISRVLFKEAITKGRVLALCLAMTGIVFISGVLTGSAPLTPLGLALGVFTGLLYALWTIFSRLALNRGYHPVTIVTYAYLIAGIGGLFVTDWTSVPSIIAARPSALLFILLFAFLVTILPTLLNTWGLAGVTNSEATILTCFDPLTATILGLLFYGEVPTISTLLGIAFIVAAVFVLGFASRDYTREQARQ